MTEGVKALGREGIAVLSSRANCLIYGTRDGLFVSEGSDRKCRPSVSKIKAGLRFLTPKRLNAFPSIHDSLFTIH